MLLPMNSALVLPVGILGLGTTELMLIMAVILLLFGGSKLPSLARGLGQSIREFKKASNEEDEKAASEKLETKTTEVVKSTK